MPKRMHKRRRLLASPGSSRPTYICAAHCSACKWYVYRPQSVPQFVFVFVIGLRMFV